MYARGSFIRIFPEDFAAMKTARTPLLSFASIASIALAALASLQGEALAHTLLVTPAPLTDNDDAKSGPCGCEIGGDPACPANYPQTTLTAGENVTVTWKETVNHTGSFRLAFSNKPVDQVTGADLDANVLYDKADENDTNGGTISTTILVPDMPCAACTLQLRQFMEGAANPYYYSCANIKIVAPSGQGGAGGAGGSGSGNGGSGTGGEDGVGGDMNDIDSTGPGPATTPPKIETGGLCSAGGGPAGSAGFFGLGALALAVLVRRGRGGALVKRARTRE